MAEAGCAAARYARPKRYPLEFPVEFAFGSSADDRSRIETQQRVMVISLDGTAMPEQKPATVEGKVSPTRARWTNAAPLPRTQAPRVASCSTRIIPGGVSAAAVRDHLTGNQRMVAIQRWSHRPGVLRTHPSDICAINANSARLSANSHRGLWLDRRDK